LHGWSGVVIAGGAAAGHPICICTRARGQSAQAIACGVCGAYGAIFDAVRVRVCGFDAVRDGVCGCDGVKLLAMLPDMFCENQG
jgi:hypothetical protein